MECFSRLARPGSITFRSIKSIRWIAALDRQQQASLSGKPVVLRRERIITGLGRRRHDYVELKETRRDKARELN
jgi:hypothetical protein